MENVVRAWLLAVACILLEENLLSLHWPRSGQTDALAAPKAGDYRRVYCSKQLSPQLEARLEEEAGDLAGRQSWPDSLIPSLSPPLEECDFGSCLSSSLHCLAYVKFVFRRENATIAQGCRKYLSLHHLASNFSADFAKIWTTREPRADRLHAFAYWDVDLIHTADTVPATPSDYFRCFVPDPDYNTCCPGHSQPPQATPPSTAGQGPSTSTPTSTSTELSTSRAPGEPSGCSSVHRGSLVLGLVRLVSGVLSGPAEASPTRGWSERWSALPPWSQWTVLGSLGVVALCLALLICLSVRQARRGFRQTFSPQGK